MAAFERAGFYGVEMPVLQDEPWQTVQGIEFRSATVIAYKGKDGPCFEHNEAVIYRGPFASVTDELGHTFDRGERIAVCRKAFEILTREPYAEHFVAVSPRNEIDPADAKPLSCTQGKERRPPKVTKGPRYNASILPVADGCCDTGECC